MHDRIAVAPTIRKPGATMNAALAARAKSLPLKAQQSPIPNAD
ncbi:hypothetical protein [Burkholderia thailandensis]|nr:hypothetical protein [Burkholderia thailandensis]